LDLDTSPVHAIKWDEDEHNQLKEEGGQITMKSCCSDRFYHHIYKPNGKRFLFLEEYGITTGYQFFFSTSFEHMCITGPIIIFLSGIIHLFSQKDECGQV
jgi:hypothetical protein